MPRFYMPDAAAADVTCRPGGIAVHAVLSIPIPAEVFEATALTPDRLAQKHSIPAKQLLALTEILWDATTAEGIPVYVEVLPERLGHEGACRGIRVPGTSGAMPLFMRVLVPVANQEMLDRIALAIQTIIRMRSEDEETDTRFANPAREEGDDEEGPPVPRTKRQKRKKDVVAHEFFPIRDGPSLLDCMKTVIPSDYTDANPHELEKVKEFMWQNDGCTNSDLLSSLLSLNMQLDHTDEPDDAFVGLYHFQTSSAAYFTGDGHFTLERSCRKGLVRVLPGVKHGLCDYLLPWHQKPQSSGAAKQSARKRPSLFTSTTKNATSAGSMYTPPNKTDVSPEDIPRVVFPALTFLMDSYQHMRITAIKLSRSGKDVRGMIEDMVDFIDDLLQNADDGMLVRHVHGIPETYGNVSAELDEICARIDGHRDAPWMKDLMAVRSSYPLIGMATLISLVADKMTLSAGHNTIVNLLAGTLETSVPETGVSPQYVLTGQAQTGKSRMCTTAIGMIPSSLVVRSSGKSSRAGTTGKHRVGDTDLYVGQTRESMCVAFEDELVKRAKGRGDDPAKDAMDTSQKTMGTYSYGRVQVDPVTNEMRDLTNIMFARSAGIGATNGLDLTDQDMSRLVAFHVGDEAQFMGEQASSVMTLLGQDEDATDASKAARAVVQRVYACSYLQAMYDYLKITSAPDTTIVTIATIVYNIAVKENREGTDPCLRLHKPRNTLRVASVCANNTRQKVVWILQCGTGRGFMHDHASQWITEMGVHNAADSSYARHLAVQALSVADPADLFYTITSMSPSTSYLRKFDWKILRTIKTSFLRHAGGMPIVVSDAGLDYYVVRGASKKKFFSAVSEHMRESATIIDTEKALHDLVMARGARAIIEAYVVNGEVDPSSTEKKNSAVLVAAFLLDSVTSPRENTFMRAIGKYFSKMKCPGNLKYPVPPSRDGMYLLINRQCQSCIIGTTPSVLVRGLTGKRPYNAVEVAHTLFLLKRNTAAGHPAIVESQTLVSLPCDLDYDMRLADDHPQARWFNQGAGVSQKSGDQTGKQFGTFMLGVSIRGMANGDKVDIGHTKFHQIFRYCPVPEETVSPVSIAEERSPGDNPSPMVYHISPFKNPMLIANPWYRTDGCPNGDYLYTNPDATIARQIFDSNYKYIMIPPGPALRLYIQLLRVWNKFRTIMPTFLMKQSVELWLARQLVLRKTPPAKGTVPPWHNSKHTPVPTSTHESGAVSHMSRHDLHTHERKRRHNARKIKEWDVLSYLTKVDRMDALYDDVLCANPEVDPGDVKTIHDMLRHLCRVIKRKNPDLHSPFLTVFGHIQDGEQNTHASNRKRGREDGAAAAATACIDDDREEMDVE